MARFLPLLLLCASLLGGRTVAAQAPVGAPEADLKAAFLYNFAIFTDWPLDTLPAAAPFRLCAFQGNVLQAALVPLQDKVVNGHRVHIKLLTTPLGAAQLASCHLLVLDWQDRDRWPLLRQELSSSSVLTVADDRIIGTSGAMISLGMDNRRIGFDVDLGPVRQARLTLSSKLLRLARSVQ
jgi:hypothetical protein